MTGAVVLAGCTRSAPAPSIDATTSAASTSTATSNATPSSSAPPTSGTPQEVLARSTVPVLCFHQLREFRADDSAYARTMITPPPVFTAQLQALRDGGYTPITAAALADHLQFGAGLPPGPAVFAFGAGCG